jgi:hypothetical protein
MPSMMVGIVFSVEPVEQLERCLKAIEEQIPLIEKHGVRVAGLLIKTPTASHKHPRHFFGKTIQSESENISLNRNMVLDNSAADWVYFTDPDCVLNKGSLETLVLEAFRQQGQRSIYAVAGANILFCEPSKLNQAFRWLGNCLWLNGGTAQLVTGKPSFLSRHSPTCNILYFMDRVGDLRFSPQFSRVGEDIELNFRLSRNGSRVFIQTNAAVFHEQSPSFLVYLSKVFGYGRAQTQLLKRDLGNALNPRLIVLYGSMAFVAFCRMAPSYVQHILALTFTTGILIFTIEYERFRERKNFFYMLWFLTSIYGAYLLGQWSGLVLPLARKKSEESISASI